MKEYEVYIYFIGNVHIKYEKETDMTKEQLTKYYIKKLKSKKTFEERCDAKNEIHIIRPETVSIINIKLIK
jgi:hypothetical protein